MDWVKGYIVHRQPYRDTSYILRVLTSDGDLLSVVAKGYRASKPTGKSAEKLSLTQPFLLLNIRCKGSRSLKTLFGLELAGNLIGSLDGRCLYCAIYLNELVSRVGQEGVQLSIFESYQQCLLGLYGCSSDDSSIQEVLLREFELALIQALGYGISFSHDAVTGQPLLPNSYYVFVQEQGFVLVTPSLSPLSLFRAEDLLAISARCWTSTSLKTAKILMRQMLLPLLGGKPLKSRELFLAPIGSPK